MLNDNHKPFLDSVATGHQIAKAVRELAARPASSASRLIPCVGSGIVRPIFSPRITPITNRNPVFSWRWTAKFPGICSARASRWQNQLYALYQNVWLFFPCADALLPVKTQRSRRFIRWILAYGWREVSRPTTAVPHFHINLLPEARKVPTTRALMSAYLSYLYRSGEKRVCGQIVTFESRRGEKMLRTLRLQGFESGRDHQYQSVLPRIGLPQHGYQKLGNRRSAFRLFTRTRVTRNRRAKPIWRAAPVPFVSKKKSLTADTIPSRRRL